MHANLWLMWQELLKLHEDLMAIVFQAIAFHSSPLLFLQSTW